MIDADNATEAVETVNLVQPLEDLTLNNSLNQQQQQQQGGGEGGGGGGGRDGNFEEVNLLGDF